MSLGDSGALSASAISCAFCVTLAFLVRIVLIASVKLFCRPCLAAPAAALFMCPNRESRLGCHRSAPGIALPLGCGAGEGLPLRDELWPYSSSSSGMRSGWKAGNLNVWLGLGSRADVSVIATVLEGVVGGRYRGAVRYAMGKGCDGGVLDSLVSLFLAVWPPDGVTVVEVA
jgi:hypothetical protein